MLNRTTKSWTILAAIAFATSFGALSAAYAQDDAGAPPPPPPPPPPPAASSSASAPDAPPPPGGQGGRRRGPRFTMGTVTEVSSDGFLVKPSFGTSLITVTTTSDTHYNIVTIEKATDLKVGDKVLVMAQPSATPATTASTSITARMIMVGDTANPFERPGGRRAGGGGFGGPPPGAGGGPRGGFTPPVSGTIASVSPLKVTGSDGKTYTVTTTDSTTIALHQPGAVSDLLVGKFVMVMPVRPAPGTAPPAPGSEPTSVTADSVTIAPTQEALGGGGRFGGGRRFGGGGGGFGGGPGAGAPPPPQ